MVLPGMRTGGHLRSVLKAVLKVQFPLSRFHFRATQVSASGMLAFSPICEGRRLAMRKTTGALMPVWTAALSDNIVNSPGV